MIRLLVTGGAGYLGSTLVPALLAEGHRVTVLDNFSHGVQSLNHVAHDRNLEIVRGDVRDDNLVASLVSEADAIIPLAAIVGAPACQADRWTAEQVNYDAIESMCQVLSAEQAVIFPTTNSGYGVGQGDVECTEESPLNPISDYGWQKKYAEQRVMDRPNSVSLRLATVFGMSPRHRWDLLVNEFVWRAVVDRTITVYEPNARRNYIHVLDVAAAFIHILNNWQTAKGNVFNVGDTSANMTKISLAQRIKARLPSTQILMADGADPDKRDYVISNAKIEATGWRPQHTLDDGIVEVIKGARQFKKFAQGNV